MNRNENEILSVSSTTNLRPSLTASYGSSIYELYRADLLFEEALTNASALELNGAKGHLVNITSQAENDFLKRTFMSNESDYFSTWIGVSVPQTEDLKWRWIAGPEAGQELSFSNWSGNSPETFSFGAYMSNDGYWQTASMIINMLMIYPAPPIEDYYPRNFYIVEYSNALPEGSRTNVSPTIIGDKFSKTSSSAGIIDRPYHYIPGPGFSLNGYTYIVTNESFAPTDNVVERIQSTYGPTAELVDWNYIQQDFEVSDVRNLISSISLPTSPLSEQRAKASLLVSLDGRLDIENGWRQKVTNLPIDQGNKYGNVIGSLAQFPDQGASQALIRIDNSKVVFVSIPENSPANTVIYRVTAADPDPNTTLSYSIVGGADATRFSIDSKSGDVTFKSSPNYENPKDSGSDNVYDIIVAASDGMLSATQHLQIGVTDVVERLGAKFAFKGNVYELISGNITIEDAINLAGSKIHNGKIGHVITIDNGEEQQAIFNWFKDYLNPTYYGPHSWFWLGGSFQQVSGKWIWITGSQEGQEWKYSNWGPNQPKFGSGEIHVGVTDGGWWNSFKPGAGGSVLIEYKDGSQYIGDRLVLDIATTSLKVNEGTEKNTEISISITRPNANNAETLSWWVTRATEFLDGVAVDHIDFINKTLPSGQIDFSTGEATKTVTVSVHGDCVWEFDELFNFFVGYDTGTPFLYRINGKSETEDRVTFQVLNDDSKNSNLRFDIDGNAGKAYRLYEAALDRTPDCKGLAEWINYLDAGNSLVSMAEQFINSPEFSAKYGPLNNFGFVNQLYLNVLERNGETQGLNDWNNALQSTHTRADVLVGFSESAENKASIDPTIIDGVVYWRWWLD